MAGNRRRQAPAFAADHDDGVRSFLQGVHIVADEIAAEDGELREPLRGVGQRDCEIDGVHWHARERTHARVDDLLVKHVGAVR